METPPPNPLDEAPRLQTPKLNLNPALIITYSAPKPSSPNSHHGYHPLPEPSVQTAMVKITLAKKIMIVKQQLLGKEKNRHR